MLIRAAFVAYFGVHHFYAARHKSPVTSSQVRINMTTWCTSDTNKCMIKILLMPNLIIDILHVNNQKCSYLTSGTRLRSICNRLVFKSEHDLSPAGTHVDAS